VSHSNRDSASIQHGTLDLLAGRNDDESKRDVRAASDEELLAVAGVGDETLANLKESRD